MTDPAQDLRDAAEELRHLPLGGRGHLADACLDGAAEIEALRSALTVGTPCACIESCGDVDEDADNPLAACKGLPR